ncbi:MAG TPA: superinfection immunity protein [Candidatus Solibacter sp.]|jgi:hypothetical protein|nr:superinfection immunity protein [Candidatus Solibacter sp.]
MLDAIGSLIGGLILTFGLAVLMLLYFLPSIVVLMRRADDMVGVVIVLNVFLGWTFLGWVASLAMAFSGSSGPRQGYPQPYIYPPAPPTPVYYPASSNRNGVASEPHLANPSPNADS